MIDFLWAWLLVCYGLAFFLGLVGYSCYRAIGSYLRAMRNMEPHDETIFALPKEEQGLLQLSPITGELDRKWKTRG